MTAAPWPFKRPAPGILPSSRSLLTVDEVVLPGSEEKIGGGTE